MRRYLYLSTAVAGVMMTAGAGVSFAQCVTTQNCAELGYTETSCPDGTGIKCPFGDTFACTGGSSEITPEQCTQLGFTHTCTDANETGGSGTACDSKYTACTCTSGYEWKDGTCQKQVLNGAQGELYYCNGTVVGVRATGMDFYVAMNEGTAYFSDRAQEACKNYTFCGNIKGTLPTLDQLEIIYNNKSRVNTLLSSNGGTKITEGTYWSSTTGGYSNRTYCLNMSTKSQDCQTGKYYRPIFCCIGWDN